MRTFYLLISAAIKLSVLFVGNKVISLALGPKGISEIATLQNYILIFTSVAAGTFTNAIVIHLGKVWSTKNLISRKLIAVYFGFSITTSLLLIVAFSLLLYAGILSWNSIYASNIHLGTIFIIGTFNSINILTIACLNGIHKSSSIAISNILGNLLALTVLLIAFRMGEDKILILASISLQSMTLFFSFPFLYYALKKNYCNRKLLQYKISRKFAKLQVLNLFRLGFMVLPSLILLPIIQITFRNSIISEFGIELAGNLDAVWKISSAYMMICGMLFSYILLPELASSNSEMSKKIHSFIKLHFTGICLFLLTLFALRTTVIELLFTNEFVFAVEFLPLQNLMDAIKLLAWVFIIKLNVMRKVKLVIILETTCLLLFLIMSQVFLSSMGVYGFYSAGILAYLFLLLASIFLAHRGNGGKSES